MKCKICEKEIIENEENIHNGLCEECYMRRKRSKIPLILGVVALLSTIIVFNLGLLFAIPLLFSRSKDAFFSILGLLITKIVPIFSFTSLAFNICIIIKQKAKETGTKIGLLLSAIASAIWISIYSFIKS